jgi:hypothetical protein
MSGTDRGRASHLGARVSALVDGELGHELRDRALAHVAGCRECQADLDAERAVKVSLTGAVTPGPAPELVASLRALAAPGGPLPPRARSMPLGPVVPELPPPGRRRQDSRRPGRPGPAARSRVRRGGYVAVGALSLAGLVLGTAFAAGTQSGGSGVPVVPPTAELSVQHRVTTTGFMLGDPGLGANSFVVGTADATVRRR